MTDKTKLQQYAEAVTALAEGKKIQCFSMQKWDERQEWIDWHITTPPSFESYDGFRVKPDRKFYRVAKMQYGTNTADDKDEENGLKSSPSFVEWLTDWIEYD